MKDKQQYNSYSYTIIEIMKQLENIIFMYIFLSDLWRRVNYVFRNLGISPDLK